MKIDDAFAELGKQLLENSPFKSDEFFVIRNEKLDEEELYRPLPRVSSHR